jgi:hypothetical protein
MPLDLADPKAQGGLELLPQHRVKRRHFLDKIVQGAAQAKDVCRASADQGLNLPQDPLQGVWQAFQRFDPALDNERPDNFVDQGIAQVQLRRELVEEGPLRQAGLLDNVIDAHALKPMLKDKQKGGPKNFLARDL